MSDQPMGDQTYTQKFQKWDRVHIADTMPSYMSHFDHGVDAIVEYTYQEGCRHHGVDLRSAKQYRLWLINRHGDVYNGVSWYEEDQLTLVNTNHDDNKAIVQSYIQRRRK